MCSSASEFKGLCFIGRVVSKIGLIPAAGLGTRLGLSFPKELLAVGDKALIDYSIDNLLAANIRTICIVIRQGKEIIRAYLGRTYPQVKFSFCYQNEPFGNLIDVVIKSAIPLVHGHEVHFAMADTKLAPTPYIFFGHEKIVLHCFRTKGEEWRNFGCIVNKASVVDKPNSKIGDLCWGAISWPSAFTEYLTGQHDFTLAINSFGFIVKESISTYKDYGITKNESMTPVNYDLYGR